MRYQSYAYGHDHFALDPDLPGILSRFWPAFEGHREQMGAFGRLCGGEAYEIAMHVDAGALPVHRMHDLDGRRVDRVELCPAHRALLKRLAPMNRPPYEGGSWHEHFALGYLLADPGLYCTLIVTNQTAYAIHKYAPQVGEWKEALLSGERWGATWMTETQGGSDLGANATRAEEVQGEWRLHGTDKYFASNAGLADLALVTARPEGAPPGPKGLALFLVPRLREDGELNYLLRRLKAKSGTRAVPTGEVEFHDSQAWLVGEASQGIYYTLETLTVSRLGNAIGAVGVARKAHLECLGRVRRRMAFGKALQDHPLMRHDLTDLEVRIAGGLALAFYAIELFDRAWEAEPPYSPDYHYARFVSHLVKNRTAEHAAWVTRTAMEIFGGLGFMEENPLPRLHREALVTGIWEGTSNIQALDLLEAMQKKAAHEAFLDAVLPVLNQAGSEAGSLAAESLQQRFSVLESWSPPEAQWHAKDFLRALADAATVAVLYDCAQAGGERFARLAELYAAHFIAGESYPSWAMDEPALWLPPETEVLASSV